MLSWSMLRALLLTIAVAGPALAQTAGPATRTNPAPGPNQGNPVSLPSIASGATPVPATTAAAAAGGAGGGRSAAGGGGSAGASNSGGSGGGPSASAPAWLLCPPPGATAIAPFVAGTDLSCAP